MGAISFLQPRHQWLSHQSPDNVNEEEREELLPEPNNIESDKGDVEQISECDQKFVNKVFNDDAVLVTFSGIVSLKLCQLNRKGSINHLIESVSDEHVEDVGNLIPAGVDVEDPTLVC